jgi:lipopolysaccharide/colanic/teichoic acid biosynthesis glycosyltransferase
MTRRTPLAPHEADALALSELPSQPVLDHGLRIINPPSHLLNQLFSQKSTAERIAFAHSLVEQPKILDSSAILAPDPSKPSNYDPLKRCLDILVTTVLLIVLLPVFMITALAIVIDSRGPALYFQTRVGRNGRKFKFYKFRSMVKDADTIKDQLMDQNEAVGPNFKIRNDPRVTKVGKVIRKLSIDELPQLLDVIRGEMSLIGPRPLVVDEADTLGDRYSKRHFIKPGLLCLREICGRSALTFQEWMELDLLYIQNRSLITDLRILFKAAITIIKGDNAY